MNHANFVLVALKGLKTKSEVSPPFQKSPVNLSHCARFVFISRFLFSIFVLVELAWDNAGKRTGSSNHEKTT